MKTNAAIRYAVFLLLLILGQEFSAARYVKAPVEQSIGSIHQQVEEEETEETNAVAIRQRHKRSVGGIIIAVTVGVSVGSLGFEIYNKIKGCCGLYPSACDDVKKLIEIKKTLEVESKVVDEIALKAENRKEDVIHANYKLSEMWLDLKRIGEYQVRLIETISPGVIKNMNNKWFEIEQQLKNKNKTVEGWSYLQVDLQFQSYLDDVKTAMLGLSSFMGYGMTGMSVVAYKYYKQNNLNKMITQLSTGDSYKQLVNARHTKAAKVTGMNDVGINNYIKETATAKVDSKFGGSKYTTFMKGLNVAASALTIGFEIYSIYQKVDQCKQKADAASNDLETIKKGRATMREFKKNATIYYNLVNIEGWKFISDQLVSAKFQQSLTDIKTAAEESDTKTPEIKSAIAKIGNFLANINSSVSNSTATRALQIDLIDGLGSIKFLLKCLVEKGKLINHVSYECKIGVDSLEKLYNSSLSLFGVNDAGCTIDSKGTPYTNYKNLVKTIAEKAKSENYSIDCILNNADKKKEACKFVNADGYSKEYTAKKMGLTVAQVKYFVQDCPVPPLSPAQINQICMLRAMGVKDVAIAKTWIVPTQKLSTIQAVKCK